MRLQPKSLISSLSLGHSARAQANAARNERESPHEIANMQSLAAELQQSATQGLFEYPRHWLLIAKAIAVVFTLASLLHLSLVAVSGVRTAGAFPRGLFSWEIAGAALGAAVAIAAGALLVNLFPSIQVTPQGLGVSELLGYRQIPWEQIGVLRIMELSTRSCYAVMIPFNGATNPRSPAPMLGIAPFLAGAAQWGERGVLISSYINNFERLLQLIVSYLSQASGQSIPAIEAFVDEEAAMPVAQLVLDPEMAIIRMARPTEVDADPYGLTSAEVDSPLVWRTISQKQAFIALVPLLYLLVDILARGGNRPPSFLQVLWLLALFGVGMLELIFVGRLVQAVGELTVGSGFFARTVRAYIELQLPRVMLIVVGIVMLSMNLPVQLAQACWLGGIVITTMFVTRFTQRMYYLPLSRSLIATIGAFIFQLSVFALYFGAR